MHHGGVAQHQCTLRHLPPNCCVHMGVLCVVPLCSELGGTDLTPMSLGLSHSLSRYKLKFSPEKVDTMIVQVSCCTAVKTTLVSVMWWGAALLQKDTM